MPASVRVGWAVIKRDIVSDEINLKPGIHVPRTVVKKDVPKYNFFKKSTLESSPRDVPTNAHGLITSLQV